MAYKFEIINKSLVITDTENIAPPFDFPKADVYYSSHELNRPIPIVSIKEKYTFEHKFQCFLSDAIDKNNIPFTFETFVSFARSYLGFNTASGGSDAVANNYTELLTVDTSLFTGGELAYVNSSQGTAWLPGTLGGTYYPEGWYVWNGTAWVSNRNDISNELNDIETNKQDLLVSSVNIKTINGESVLGSGNILTTFDATAIANASNVGRFRYYKSSVPIPLAIGMGCLLEVLSANFSLKSNL